MVTVMMTITISYVAMTEETAAGQMSTQYTAVNVYVRKVHRQHPLYQQHGQQDQQLKVQLCQINVIPSVNKPYVTLEF